MLIGPVESSRLPTRMSSAARRRDAERHARHGQTSRARRAMKSIAASEPWYCFHPKVLWQLSRNARSPSSGRIGVWIKAFRRRRVEGMTDESVLETQRPAETLWRCARGRRRWTSSLRQGELRCLIGPNGAGKSTFFKLLSGQLRPRGGRILFEGVAIGGLAMHQIAPARDRYQESGAERVRTASRA